MLSINARILASASLVLIVFIAATGLVLDRAFHESARSARQERLQGQVYLLIGAAEVDPQGQVVMPPSLSEARFNISGSGLYGAINHASGERVWNSPSALNLEVPFSPSLGAGIHQFDERYDSSGRPYFVYALGINWAAGTKQFPLTFMVAEGLTEFNTQLGVYRRSVWSWLGAMAVLLLVVQVLVLRWSLLPLRRAARDLSAIEAGRQARLEAEYPRELKPLTDNLNALLRREHAQQKRYQDALADLAHSLKTPLAVMRGALTSEAERLSNTVEEQVQRMDRIVAYQLQRAATAERSGGLAVPIAVKPIVQRVVASLNKVYGDKQVTSIVEVDGDIRFAGNEGDLLELLGNLIDNAYKWCATTVRVRAQVRDGGLCIAVEDDGPGIGHSEAEHILERGVRTDQAVPGHGIGLAVVRDIINAYEGKIAIGSSPLGGAAVSLNFRMQ